MSLGEVLDIWPYKIDMREDNPNKKILIDIPDSVYSCSPVVHVKIGLRWENPSNRLDVSVSDRGPYLVDDPVPSMWEQAQQ